MGREHRIELAGALYHLGTKGNNGARIVLDDADRRRWVETLRICEGDFGWKVHIYCLLDTHYHLLVETSEENLSDAMHWLNHVYAKSFNRRHDREDHVFGKRFWDDVIVSDERLVAVVRYIGLNPVEAGLCERPEQWPWSNYGALRALAFAKAATVPRSIADLIAQGARLAAAAGLDVAA